jgi:hypothetical protein
MMKSTKNFLAVCTLLLAALVLQAGAAAACSQECVAVSGTACHQCVEVGYFTGITCQPSSSCICQRTPNACGLIASGIQAQTGLAAMTIPTDKGAVCSAAPVTENAPLNSLVQ